MHKPDAMKRILFPTDFSDAAMNAFVYANAFASAQGAVIDLLHVFHIPISDSGNVLPEYIEDLIAQGEKGAQQELENLVLPYKGSATIGRLKAVYGLFTGLEIMDYAKQGGYDLILMGTKGERSNLERWMGSITTEVMMKAPCPVLAIPAHAAFDTITNIAYATAFDPSDQPAVEQLLHISEGLGAQLHFVHVNTHSSKRTIEDIPTVKDSPYRFTDFSVINNTSILDGLDQYIEERRVDWLALFIPHRRLWERLFHASISKKMTFHSNVPLLVFHG